MVKVLSLHVSGGYDGGKICCNRKALFQHSKGKLFLMDRCPRQNSSNQYVSREYGTEVILN